MKLQASVVPKEQWKKIEDAAHADLFGEWHMDEARNYDFTVLVNTESGENFSYGLVKEMDAETAYLTFGGMFSQFKGQGTGYQGMREIVSVLKEKYKRVGFACRVKNVGMIKLGLNEGFEIIGLRMIYGFLNVEFLLEKGN